MIEVADLNEIITKVSKHTHLTEAAIRNLLHFQADLIISTRLDTTLAELDCVLSGEENYRIAELFGLTQADFGNLIVEYGKEFILGMLLAKLILDNNK